LASLDQRVKRIEARNKRVESDKAWETSWTRRIAIAVLTYIVIAIVFWMTGLGKPFLNALVPTTAFILSTLTVSALKKWWIARR
jgi:hypothetical protein